MLKPNTSARWLCVCALLDARLLEVTAQGPSVRRALAGSLIKTRKKELTREVRQLRERRRSRETKQPMFTVEPDAFVVLNKKQARDTTPLPSTTPQQEAGARDRTTPLCTPPLHSTTVPSTTRPSPPAHSRLASIWRPHLVLTAPRRLDLASARAGPRSVGPRPGGVHPVSHTLRALRRVRHTRGVVLGRLQGRRHTQASEPSP